MDLEKLTPAPWRSERRYSNGVEIGPRIKCEPDANRECGWIADLIGAPYLGYESTLVNAEFIALARNAFDVLMRRGWTAHRCQMADGSTAFWVDADNVGDGGTDPDDWNPSEFESWLENRAWPDPFTALVEADKWFRENVEAGAHHGRRHGRGSGGERKPGNDSGDHP